MLVLLLFICKSNCLQMEKVTLNLIEVGGKARSKLELYKLLTVDGHLYLPPYKYCSVNFMADIIEGNRKVGTNTAALCFILIRHSKQKMLWFDIYPILLDLEQKTWLISWSMTVIQNIIFHPSIIRLFYIGTGFLISVSNS